MPSEPEKPVEKLLRAASKARRERAGDAWEIHPATRRLWQREVERQFSSRPPARESWYARLLRAPWLRFAGAVATVAIIGVFSWALMTRSSPRPQQQMAALNRALAPVDESRPDQANAADKAVEELKKEAVTQKSKQLLAQNEIAPKERQLEEKPRENGAPTKDGGKQSEPFQDQSTVAAASGAPAQLAKTEPSSQMASASPSSSTDAEQAFAARYGFKGRAEARDATALRETDASAGSAANLAAKQPAPGAPQGDLRVPASESPPTNVVQYGMFAAAQTTSPQSNAQALSRRASRALATSASTQQAQRGILVSFRVEQNGQQLRIIDSDGSIYEGPIRDNNAQLAGIATSAVAHNAPEAEAVRVDALAVPVAAPAAGSFFQVSGTNVRSQERVVFSGTLLPVTNLPVTLGRLGAQSQRGLGGVARFAQTNAPLQSIRVSGTAVINGNEQVHIEATPVPR